MVYQKMMMLAVFSYLFQGSQFCFLYYCGDLKDKKNVVFVVLVSRLPLEKKCNPS